MSIRIPVLQRIETDKIQARDGNGLALYEDGGNGIFVKDGGNVGIGTASPGYRSHLSGGENNAKFAITNTEADEASILLETPMGIVISLNVGDTNEGVVGSVAGDYVISNRAGGKILLSADVAHVEHHLVILETGKIGVSTTIPANPLAVNRQANDGVVIDIEQADAVEGTISVSGTTVSYNSFMGAHYTQLKVGQKTPPVGAIVVATGELIPCESNIEVPVIERYYEEELEVTLNKEALEGDIIEEQVDTGRKRIVYKLVLGKMEKTKTPIFETVKKSRGKKLRDNFRIDEEDGKLYKKVFTVLKDDEKAPDGIPILEREKTLNEKPVTELKTKDVSGIKKKEYFSYVKLASKKADSMVYGVYHAKLSDDAKGQSFGKDDKAVHQIAALGLYKVRVADTNGSIVAGDYIQSSIRPGEGEKQDDNILHNYTVAKSIIDVNWSGIDVDPELGYKWRLIPATLHCG